MSTWSRLLISALFFLNLSKFGLAEPDILENQPTTLVYPPFWHTPFGIHRGTPELLALFVGTRTTLFNPQDLACTLLLTGQDAPDKPAEFQLTVIGSNTGRGHLIYNPDLSQLDVLGDRPPSQGLLRAPLGLTALPTGLLYVADGDLPGVVCFRNEKSKYVPAGFLSPPPNGWKKPWGIAHDSQGMLYITDAGQNQIHIYSSQGVWQHTLGPVLSPDVTLSAPRAITVVGPQEPWSFYHNHLVFVCDQAGKRLLRLAGNGSVQGIQLSSALPDSTTPAAFAWMDLDYYENLWVTDPARSQVHKFNRQLDYLTSFGEYGTGDGRLNQPTGIAIHRHFGQIFIAEAEGVHYFWVGSDILSARALLDSTDPLVARVDFFLTEPAWLTIEVEAKKHEVICKKQWMDSGPQTVVWHLSKKHSSQTQFVLTAEATYSSAKYKAKRVRVLLPDTQTQ